VFKIFGAICGYLNQVKITDYEPKRPLKTLLAGEPSCSPIGSTLAESHISLIRKLHCLEGWTKTV